jgi:hypothetical protein
MKSRKLRGGAAIPLARVIRKIATPANARRVAGAFNVAFPNLIPSVKQDLISKIKAATDSSPVQRILNQMTGSPSGSLPGGGPGRPRKSPLAPSSKVRASKVAAREAVKNSEILLGVPAMGSGKRQDNVTTVDSSSITRIVANVRAKMFIMNQRIVVPRSKSFREVMKEFPGQTIRLRDDDVGIANNYQRRLYSTCGVNRKGLWAPVSSGIAIKPWTGWPTALQQGVTGFPMNRYDYGRLSYSPAFSSNDYDALLTLGAYWAWWFNQMSPEDRAITSLRFPVSEKKLSVTITNRNTYTPTKVTIYVVRNRSTQTVPCAYNVYTDRSLNTNTPIQYLYSVDSPPTQVLDDVAAPVANAFFNTETSMHLKASPVMGQAFTDFYTVVSVHKKLLGPSDVLTFNLAVGMNGLDMQDVSDNFQLTLPNDVPQSPRYVIGDYQLLVTFEGIPKFTAAFRKHTAGSPNVVSFPAQLAVSAVTNPCDIDLKTAVSFVVNEKDYYGQGVLPIYRMSQYSQPSIISGANVAQLEFRLQAFRSTVFRKERNYPENFNVPYSDLVQASTATGDTRTGYFVEVATNVDYKGVDSIATYV